LLLFMLVLLFVSSLFDDDVFFERFGGISLKLSLFSSLVVGVSRAPTLKTFFKKCSHAKEISRKKQDREVTSSFVCFPIQITCPLEVKLSH